MRKMKLPHGVIEETHTDGTKTYTGKGGGVVEILPDGSVFVFPPDGYRQAGEKHRDDIEDLWYAWKNPVPTGPITAKILKEKSACAAIMLQALQNSDAAFFRELADCIKPRTSAKNKADELKKEREKMDAAVFDSIIKAATEVLRLPHFEDVLKFYRKTKGNNGTAPAHFKRRLKARGFEWLGAVVKS